MIRRLPIGIQDFGKLRDEGHVYVDKTAIIYDFISKSSGAYFFARPRRFGKSLLCSTLRAIFQGRRELFQEIKGYPALVIDSLDWEWKKYPVILLNMNAGDYTQGEAGMRTSVSFLLGEIAKTESIELRGENISDQFKALIIDLHKKYNERVVVIIDEYDKPLLDTIDDKETHEKYRKILKSFYGILKASDEYLKLTFITGVTKFSQVSIFSDLNHLADISFDKKYSILCGLTQEEVEQNFEPEIISVLENEELTREDYFEKLRLFYNGYRFTEKDQKVFNPFGLLQHFLSEGKFLSYWFDSGSSSFLVKLVKDSKINILDLQKMRIDYDSFKRFDIDNLETLPILYQSGYLTIVDYDKKYNEFVLDYPNLEVRSAFSKVLLTLINPNSYDITVLKQISGTLNRGEIDKTLTIIKQFLANTPYDLVKNTENYYHTAIHLIFSMLGLDCRSEVRIAAGRIDTVVKTDTHIYCFEFKLDKPAKEALAQIDTKEYMLPYENEGKILVKIGVSFSSEKRNIDDWELRI